MNKETESTFNNMLSLYQRLGSIEKFKRVSKEIVSSPNSTRIMRGEVAESLLYVMLEHYIKVNNIKDWRITKGTILKKKKNNGKHHMCELDVTLFTPKCIFCFECKSYKGKTFLLNEGSLFTVGKDNNLIFKVDVYKQQMNHVETLEHNLSYALVEKRNGSKYRSLKILMFDFADISTVDKRVKVNRELFPLLNENSLYNLFIDYNKRPTYWDMDKVNKILDIIEKNKSQLRIEHLKYVDSLHGKKG